MIGQSIEHYTITSKIGEGGMGEVYHATDTKLGRDVALKILSHELTKDPERLGRFRREAQILASLNHPAIGAIYGLEDSPPLHVLVLELVEGETLAERVRGGSTSIGAALNIALQIAEALEAAHAKGIIHRDLKPANVKLTPEGKVKVLDFGIAKPMRGWAADRDAEFVTVLTEAGSIVGTVAYMSPEQLRGDPLDARSDLFSLGILLQELITGSHPFRRSQMMATASAILNEDPAPISHPLVKDSSPVDKVLEKLLEKEPSRRYQSTRELLVDLREATRENDVAGRNRSAWRLRSPRFAVMNLALLGFVLTAGWHFLGPEAGSKSVSDRSIAVLPFRPIGQEKPGLFTEGIHDDLLTRLSNVRDFQVIGRGSVESYRGTRKASVEIARELGVRWVLEGGVQQSDNQIKLNARLVDSETGVQTWANSYVHELTAQNLFSIQGDITQRIAEALETRLTPQEERSVTDISTENLQAYRLYVQGRTYLDQREEPEMRRALELFRRAAQQDPDYALAWVGIVEALYELEDYGYAVPEGSSSEAQEAVERALALDPFLAEAHAAQGMIYHLRQNGPAALDAFDRAIQLLPNAPDSQSKLAWVSQLLGRPEMAFTAARRALELDPLAREPHVNLALTYLIRGEADEALRVFRAGSDLQQNWPTARFCEGVILYHRGRYAESIEVVRDLSIPWAGSGPVATLALAHVALGNRDQAVTLLTRLKEESEHPFHIGLVHAALGEQEAAFEVFESIESWTTDADWAILCARYLFPDVLEKTRADPRYDLLLQQLDRAWRMQR